MNSNNNNNNSKAWSSEELGKLNLAIQLYSNLDKERCEHLHKHAIPYKTTAEIQLKANELFNERYHNNKSPVLKSSTNTHNNNQSVPKTTSPTLKSTVPNHSIKNNNNNNNNNNNRCDSPSFWPNN